MAAWPRSTRAATCAWVAVWRSRSSSPSWPAIRPFLARFRREAQSAASLNHPNVVAVYDTGEDVLGEGLTAETVPFIVMELVEGITLKELLNSGNKLVPERALEITSGILAALDYSHRHGIVHRDIKPGNVMLTTTGAVKVMDFGIARATADAGHTGTSTSTVMGTAAYLSPEQAQGLTVDSRSDLYSAGVVLFELLTRRPPFVADAPVAVAFAHVNEPPPVPSTLDPTLPPQLDPIVARALAKDPAQRYQTAVEFRADVERAIAGVPVTRVMPVAPVAGPDSQATSVLGGVDPYATAAMAATGAAATGAMPPLIPGGAGDPYAAPDPMTTTAQNEPPRKGGVLKGLGIAALVIALMGAGLWLGLKLLSSTAAETVEVPRVEGLTVAKAEAELRDVGLLLGGPEVKVSDLPKDTDHQPGSTAGRARRGRQPRGCRGVRGQGAGPGPRPGRLQLRGRCPQGPGRCRAGHGQGHRGGLRQARGDGPAPGAGGLRDGGRRVRGGDLGVQRPGRGAQRGRVAPRPRPARTCSTRASRSPTTMRWRPRSSHRAPWWTRPLRGARRPRRAPW